MAGGKAPESTSFDNFDFGIEDTAGAGSTELLAGLMDDSTSTDPDDIEEIEDDEEEELPKKKKAQAPPKRTAVKAPAQPEEVEEDEDDDLSLEDQFNDDEDDEEEIIIKPKPAKKKPVAPPVDEDEDDTDASEEDEDEDDTPASPFSSISKELFRLGVFTADDEEEGLPEITTGEQFLEQFENEKKRGASVILENFLSKYGEDHRAAFQAIFINGVSPQEYLQTYTQVESFKELELDGNESAQEKVVREALKQQGFDVDDIDAEVERLKQYGDLEVTSKRYHKTLVKKEESKLTELANKKAQEREANERQEQAYQASISKILTDKAKARNFDGLTVTPQQAQETFDYLATKKYRTPSGELLTEFDRELLELKRPENHELRVKLALLLRNKLDLSKIKRNAVTQESRELFGELAAKKVKKGGATGKGGKQVSSWFS